MKLKFTHILLALIVMTGSSCAQDDPGGERIKAADFSFAGMDGEYVNLSDYKGKVVILDFWATWCPPCVKEIPHFNELAREYKDEGLVVLGISLDRGGSEDVEKFMKRNPIDYRIGTMFVSLEIDQAVGLKIEKRNMVIVDSLGALKVEEYQSYLPEEMRGGIPFTFIIDREGYIREKYVGYRDKEVFEKAIKPLL